MPTLAWACSHRFTCPRKRGHGAVAGNASTPPRPFSCLFVFLVVLSATLGCSDNRPPTYPVTGTVEFETGGPVRFGVIEFIPKKRGPSARGNIGPDGAYTLGTFGPSDGAPEGDYTVIVMQPPALPPYAAEHAPPGQTGLDAEEHAAHSDDPFKVPERFADYRNSGLTAKVLPQAENDVPIVIDRTSE